MTARFSSLVFSAAATLIVFATAGAADAVPLVGSANNFALPIGPEPDNQVRALTGGPVNFAGTWTAPALPDWIGTFTAVGPIPASTSNPAGTAAYDFTPLPLGELPAGTFFRLGDLDNGSATNESIKLQAFDIFNAVITTPWLEEPVFITGGASAVDTPRWIFDDTDLLDVFYFFDGNIVPGNPNVGVLMESNLAFPFLEVTRTSSFANFSLAAPVPEPGTGLLVMTGLLGLAFHRRRRA